MPDEFQTYDEEYNIILQGYDVAIVLSDQGPGYYYVTLYENGAEVFADDVLMPEPEFNDIEEDSIRDVAQAAIDIFEAERGTLGQGAGAEMTANTRNACLNECFDEWYMGFKGTAYEDMAYNLLSKYYALDLQMMEQDDVTHELRDRVAQIEYELKMLNLERMKTLPANTQVIIIQSSKKKSWIGDTAEYKEFVDKFTGSPLEIKVINLMKELLDVNQKLRLQEEGRKTFYQEEDELRRQMEALAEEALQVNLIDRLPTEGIEAFPNLAGELAELMEGVEMEEPLVPTMPNSFQARRAQMAQPEEPDDIYAKEWEPVENRIIEKGEVHEGLDPAETLADLPFVEGDKVSLKKKFETVSPINGVKVILESGSSGYIESEFDRAGDCYQVAFENGACLVVPADYLKSA